MVAEPQRSTTNQPKLLIAMLDAMRIPDLRWRILFTLAMLVVFRFVAHVPVPSVDQVRLHELFQGNALLGILDVFSGGALRNMSIAAMGVYPYITATIVVQILMPIIPPLQRMSKEEGDAGRRKIQQITMYMTVPIAVLQGFGQLLILQQSGIMAHPVAFFGPGALETLIAIVSMTAGSMFLVWLGERITEKGIGNGVSLIIFGGIVANLPTMIGQGIVANNNFIGLVIFGAIAVVIVALIVLFTEATRRIPVQYGRSVFRGGRMYRQSSATYLPLRVNSAGMIPLIFAFSVIILPGTIAQYAATSSGWVGTVATDIAQWLDPTRWLYWTLVFVMVVGFSFFYTIVVFQQQNLAENLQKNGGFIPGIRPGKPTADYLNRIILRITWGGALFLGIVAIIPFLASSVTDVNSIQLSSTSLLIMVGVALDTMRQLEAQLLMRQYEGFLH